MRIKSPSVHAFDPKSKHITYNPYEGYQSIDMNRAKECAENFGKCSVPEMEFLRNSKFEILLWINSINE